MYFHGTWTQWSLGRVTHKTSTDVGSKVIYGSMTFGSSFCKNCHCIHILSCMFRRDSWFQNHLYLGVLINSQICGWESVTTKVELQWYRQVISPHFEIQFSPCFPAAFFTSTTSNSTNFVAVIHRGTPAILSRKAKRVHHCIYGDTAPSGCFNRIVVKLSHCISSQ